MGPFELVRCFIYIHFKHSVQLAFSAETKSSELEAIVSDDNF